MNRSYAPASTVKLTGGIYALGVSPAHETYKRLVAVKDRYDPDNVFHLNQNVRPSGR